MAGRRKTRRRRRRSASTARRRRNPARTYHYKGAGTAWRLNGRRRRRRNAAGAGPRGYRKVMRVKRKNPKRRTRRNGKRLTLKNVFSQKKLQNYAFTGGGFIGGYLAMPYLASAAQNMAGGRARPFLGLVHIALGSILSMRSRRSNMQALGAGVAISGVYDLVAVNLKVNGQTVFAPLPSAPSAVPGLPSLGADYGYANLVNRAGLSATYQPGTETVGSTYQPNTDVVAADYQPGTEVVGADYGYTGDDEDSGLGMMDY